MSQINKALVIDDDFLQLEILRDYLERRGVRQIECVSDGNVAAHLLRTSFLPPDLIISDINMPDCDGIELLNIMRASSNPAPLILISGAPQHQIDSARFLANAYGLNVLGAFSKPFCETDLNRVIFSHHQVETLEHN